MSQVARCALWKTCIVSRHEKGRLRTVRAMKRFAPMHPFLLGSSFL